MPQDHRSDFPNSSDVNVVDVSRFAFQLKRSFRFFFKCQNANGSALTDPINAPPLFFSSGSCLGVIVLALGRPKRYIARSSPGKRSL